MEVVCTTRDPWGRRSLATEAVKLLDQGLHPVGRLDADTDGLLLFAYDGALTQRLLHPRRGIRRVYAATVEGSPGEAMRTELAQGVATAKGVFIAEVLSTDGPRVTLAVTEGKHRMVRRLLANVGHPVTELRRLSYGPLELGDLAAGASRPPTPEEWAWVQSLMAPLS
jgi:pseudouridine synthase